MKNNEKGFGAVEGVLIVVIAGLVGFAGWYAWHSKNNTNKNLSSANNVSNSQVANIKTPASTQTKTHTAQEAVAFVQKTYDDYLVALNKANNDKNNTQPVAQVGLAAVKDNLSSELYAKAAAVTQATPFSCTAQYVTDKYTASFSSSNNTNAVMSLSISNGSGLSTKGMTATVDLSSLKVVSVACPS